MGGAISVDQDDQDEKFGGFVCGEKKFGGFGIDDMKGGGTPFTFNSYPVGLVCTLISCQLLQLGVVRVQWCIRDSRINATR